MTKESLSEVRACRTVAETWTVIEGNFTSATRARTVNSRIALATTKKGELSIADYIAKMHSLRDELAIASKPLDDDDLISYILSGLDFDYNSVVTMLVAKEKLTIGEVCITQLNTMLMWPPVDVDPSVAGVCLVGGGGRGRG
jgi:hypothetical protein